MNLFLVCLLHSPAPAAPVCQTRGSSSPSGSLSHKPPLAPVCSHPCPLPPSPLSSHQDGPEEQQQEERAN